MFVHTAIRIHEDNLTHLFYNDNYAIVFDPSDPTTVKKALSKKLTNQFYHFYEIDNLEDHHPRTLLYSFTTHHHFDHSAGNKEIASICNNVLIGKSNKNYENVFYTAKFGEENILIPELDLKIECIHTPCHTLDSYCFLLTSINHEKNDQSIKKVSYLVTGDTIFFLGIGMFFEGNGRYMLNNLTKLKTKIKDISNTLVLYGHDYRDRNIPFVEIRDNVEERIKKKMFLLFEEEICLNPFFNLKRIYGEESDKNMERLRAEKTSFNKK